MICPCSLCLVQPCWELKINSWTHLIPPWLGLSHLCTERVCCNRLSQQRRCWTRIETFSPEQREINKTQIFIILHKIGAIKEKKTQRFKSATTYLLFGEPWFVVKDDFDVSAQGNRLISGHGKLVLSFFNIFISLWGIYFHFQLKYFKKWTCKIQ